MPVVSRTHVPRCEPLETNREFQCSSSQQLASCSKWKNRLATRSSDRASCPSSVCCCRYRPPTIDSVDYSTLQTDALAAGWCCSARPGGQKGTRAAPHPEPRWRRRRRLEQCKLNQPSESDHLFNRKLEIDCICAIISPRQGFGSDMMNKSVLWSSCHSVFQRAARARAVLDDATEGHLPRSLDLHHIDCLTQCMYVSLNRDLALKAVSARRMLGAFHCQSCSAQAAISSTRSLHSLRTELDQSFATLQQRGQL